MRRYAVIMAGGSGTRLWPLSRKAKSKQFLNLFGKGSFLACSITRLDGLFAREDILVIGALEQQGALLKAIEGYLPPENLIFEPVARNTAACIALAAHHVSRSGDAIMCVLPADHHIGDESAFRFAIENAISAAAGTASIITLGIAPTSPATGYGYIKAGEALDAPFDVRHVERFVEKPGREQAVTYLSEGMYYWNSGIFLAKASVMKSEIYLYLPETYHYTQVAEEALRSGQIARAYEAYARAEPIAIDFGVMEKSKKLLMAPGNFDWNDVGDFDALREVAPKDEQNNTVLKGRLLGIGASGITLYSDKKLVAAADVQDIIVVETEDVLYLCKAGSSQKTREVFKSLEKAGLMDLE